MNYREAFEESCKKRDELWASVGTLDNNVIAPLVNPAIMGGPAWPSLRQAYNIIHLGDGTILASDGLSDPYGNMDEIPENGEYQGLGLEFYIQTHDSLRVSDTGSWQLRLLMNVSNFAADDGSLINSFANGNTFSISLANPGLPDQFVHPDGYIGALLGMPNPMVPSSLELPIQAIRFINIKLLTVTELTYVMEHGKEGRNNLEALFQKQPDALYSTIERQSVL